MKRFNILRSGIIGLTVIAIMGSGLVSSVTFASQNQQTSDGQFTSGNILYVKDETQNGSWGNTINGVNQCDLLEYKAYLYNPGPSFLSNVQAKVYIPSGASTSNTAGLSLYSVNAYPQSVTANATVNLTSSQSLSYVSGSTELLNQNNQLISNLPDGLTQGGLNIGQIGASQTEFLQFDLKVGCNTPPPTPQPTYSCNLLSLTAQDNRTVEISNFTTSETNGATFSNATINWGDNTTPLVTAQPISQTHQYANYGTYTVTATANFQVSGQTKSVSSTNCTQQVTFTINTPPTVTPTTPPKQLVNTGPGNVVALFGITVAIATFGHYLFRKRQLRNY